jgi:hypothetical protein
MQLWEVAGKFFPCPVPRRVSPGHGAREQGPHETQCLHLLTPTARRDRASVYRLGSVLRIAEEQCPLTPESTPVASGWNAARLSTSARCSSGSIGKTKIHFNDGQSYPVQAGGMSVMDSLRFPELSLVSSESCKFDREMLRAVPLGSIAASIMSPPGMESRSHYDLHNSRGHSLLLRQLQ